MKFRDLDLKPEILRALDEAGYDTPMPIQEKAIPVLLTGQDLIGIAETGTGKTLAFLLPFFQQLKRGIQDPQAVDCPADQRTGDAGGRGGGTIRQAPGRPGCACLRRHLHPRSAPAAHRGVRHAGGDAGPVA